MPVGNEARVMPGLKNEYVDISLCLVRVEYQMVCVIQDETFKKRKLKYFMSIKYS